MNGSRPPGEGLTQRIVQGTLARGVLILPGVAGANYGRGGDHIHLSPPYIITPAEIDLVAEALDGTLTEIGASLSGGRLVAAAVKAKPRVLVTWGTRPGRPGTGAAGAGPPGRGRPGRVHRGGRPGVLPARRGRPGPAAAPGTAHPRPRCAARPRVGRGRPGRGGASVREAARADGQLRAADALVTAPVSKEALRLAGYRWPGQTEMLADLCAASDLRVLLMAGSAAGGAT